MIGCSTNAKQSVLITWLPRALAAGAEIRDLAMVGRVGHDAAGRATGVHYVREGCWVSSAHATSWSRVTPSRRLGFCSIRRPPVFQMGLPTRPDCSGRI